jgi:hypothetical protein
MVTRPLHRRDSTIRRNPMRTKHEQCYKMQQENPRVSAQLNNTSIYPIHFHQKIFFLDSVSRFTPSRMTPPG